MFVLALGVAILNLHTRLASLETSATLSAALITAGADLVHPNGQDQRWCRRRNDLSSPLSEMKHFPQFQFIITLAVAVPPDRHTSHGVIPLLLRSSSSIITPHGYSSTLEQYDLARILYSVWFGRVAPFSTTMRDELLVPLSRPTKTTLQQLRHAMNASSFKMNNNIDHQYHHHHQDNIGGLQRVLLGMANDIYYDTMLRGTTIAMIILLGISLWKNTTTTKTKSSSRVIATIS